MADTPPTQAPPNLPEGEEQYRGEGALTIKILRFFSFLPTFSVGPKVVDFNLFCAKLGALPADFWDLVYAMVPVDWKNSDTDQQILKIKKHFEILVLKYYELAENLKNSIL